MEIEGLDYPDAIRFLAKRAGMEVPEDDPRRVSSLRRKEHLWKLCRDAARFYHNTLKSPQGREGLQYLLSRGLTKKTIVSFGLGFAPNQWDGLKKAMLEKGYTIEDLQDARGWYEPSTGRKPMKTEIQWIPSAPTTGSETGSCSPSSTFGAM